MSDTTAAKDRERPPLTLQESLDRLEQSASRSPIDALFFNDIVAPLLPLLKDEADA